MVVERRKKDIIDNDEGETMSDVLLGEIPNALSMDVSTGYFDIGGYGLLRGAIENAVTNTPGFRLRLLLGKDTILSREGSFERYAQEHSNAGPDASAVSINESLDSENLDAGPMADTAGLIRTLESDAVEVRMGASRFNHAKCYIFGNSSAFIGSSNFTRAGLEGNHELNAGIYQGLPIEKVQCWFDRMWDMSTDKKSELISTLKQSKFGTPPEPYEIYMKMLFEKYAPFLKQDEHRMRSAVELTLFQQDAVRTAMYVMDTYNGTIIADSTGLGKTNMGIEIIRQKILNEGRKVMLVAPAQVLDSMWTEKLKEVDIGIRRKVSMERMGRDDFLDDPAPYRNIDFIVIDESQNFRSKNAQRRLNLMQLLTVGRPKQILLLTATPINNSLMDLYYQLSIITGGKDDYFWETIGIVNLYKHMRDAANSDRRRGLEKIQQLLETVMIRRTRTFIEEVYPEDKINGKSIKFPDHEYKPIQYDLAGLFGDIFDKVFSDISSLTMAPYGIGQYNTALEEDERDRHTVLAHLQIIILLKRFESSIEAVKISLANKIRMYEHVKKTLVNGRILRVGDFNKALLKWMSQEIDDDASDEEEREVRLVRSVEGIATESADGYDVKRMMSDINADLSILYNLKAAVEDVTMDKKFDAVHETILAEEPLKIEGKKVLIFTEYTATAKYLKRRLTDAFPKKNVLLIHGGTKPKTRQKYIERFAPQSNMSEDEELGEDEADILVSTEVLAEGQNLQDCNYVISYDLPWNPMKIAQRTGRINRLTSVHGTVRSRACYPDQQLDSILQLVGKLMDKIETVNLTIGLDTELLGKLPNPKQYNGRLAHDIRALAGLEEGGEDAVKRLARESDVMPETTPINEIVRHVKDIGFDAMQSVAMGRRSGRKRNGQKVVLAYLQEKPARRVHFVIYDYEKNRAEIPDNDTDAIKLAACAKDEPRHLPMDCSDEHAESFRELLKVDEIAREAIRNRDIDGSRQAIDLIQKRDRLDRNLTKLRRLLAKAMTNGQITEEDAEDANSIVTSNSMRPWPNKITEWLSTYNDSDDLTKLADTIKRFAKRTYITADTKHNETKTIETAELKLVGAMFVTGGSFEQGRMGGLDEFA